MLKQSHKSQIIPLRQGFGGQAIHKGVNFALFCVVALFCAFAAVGCAKQEIKNINSGGKNIVCFGDSITFGYGADPGEDYPSALRKMSSIPIINVGIDGDTTAEAVKRVKTDVLDRQPLLVIIEFGGNDFLRKVPLEESVRNIRQMVDLIQASGAMVAIADVSAGLFLREYSQAYARVAKEKQVIFIPQLLSGIITDPQKKSDFFHPNRDGYKIIAQRVYRAITPHLNQNIINRKFPKNS
jgi:acyl-CoA thioesterase-1